MKRSSKLTQFDWDKANSGKNWIRYKVSNEECEEVFFDLNKKVLKDIIHSAKEKRFILIGQTKLKRVLFVVFTARDGKIRVISVRDLNKKEKHLYEKTNKNSKI